MAFTNLNLNIQQLLDSTFVADMKLIINANDAVTASAIQNIVNTFQFDLVNNNIGVDSYLNQVMTNNVVLGNSITFMDSTNVIASLSKVTSGGVIKSNLSIDQIIIKPGGSIDSSGTGNQIVSTQLGVGLTTAQLTTAVNGQPNGLWVGSSAVSVPASFYGTVSLNQAITSSTENSTLNTVINATAVTVGAIQYFYCELPITATSKQFMYVTIKLPVGSTGGTNTPIYIFAYESSTSNPNPGQTFTITIQGIYLSDGVTALDTSNWGLISLAPGYDLGTSGRYPIVLNGGVAPSRNTVTDAINDLNNEHINYIQFYNSGTNIQFGSSVSLTKYNNTTISSTKWASYVVTSSNNIAIIN